MPILEYIVENAPRVITLVFATVAAVAFGATVAAGFFGATLPEQTFDLLKQVVTFSLGGVASGAGTMVAASPRVQAKVLAARSQAHPQ